MCLRLRVPRLAAVASVESRSISGTIYRALLVYEQSGILIQMLQSYISDSLWLNLASAFNSVTETKGHV